MSFTTKDTENNRTVFVDEIDSLPLVALNDVEKQSVAASNDAQK